jgi:hypothetical protein
MVSCHVDWGGDFAWGGSTDYGTENNWRMDKGPSQLDVTHRFVSNYVYEVPLDRWFGASGAARHAIGGWQLSGILIAQTGPAVSVIQANPRPAQRADYVGGDPYLHADKLLYLNRAAFALVPVSPASSQTLRNGNLGRASLRAPGLWTVNLAVGKNFYITERVKFQVRGEAFNAFNHVNLRLVPMGVASTGASTDLVNPNFGRITASDPERRMQISARLSF